MCLNFIFIFCAGYMCLIDLLLYIQSMVPNAHWNRLISAQTLTIIVIGGHILVNKMSLTKVPFILNSLVGKSEADGLQYLIKKEDFAEITHPVEFITIPHGKWPTLNIITDQPTKVLLQDFNNSSLLGSEHLLQKYDTYTALVFGGNKPSIYQLTASHNEHSVVTLWIKAINQHQSITTTTMWPYYLLLGALIFIITIIVLRNWQRILDHAAVLLWGKS